MTRVDVHTPKSFVPVDGLPYLRIAPSLVAPGVRRKIWQRVSRSRAQLVILSGLWSAWPEVRGNIMLISQRRNVIVANGSGRPTRRRQEIASRTITLRSGPEGRLFLRIETP